MGNKKQLNSYRELEICIIGNLEKNFLRKRNEAMKKTAAPLVMILNTDIEVSNFEPSLELFKKDPKLFAVTFSPESSESGIIREVEFANGGSSIYRKKIWDEIGGIDMMFEPYWWDDVDYSYRARKLGYRILEDGRIKVVKKGKLGVEILSHNPKAIFIERRNRLLFLMKHKPEEYRKIRLNLSPIWLPVIIAAELRFKRFYPKGYK